VRYKNLQGKCGRREDMEELIAWKKERWDIGNKGRGGGVRQY
jgi:hypothetical protein